MNGNYEKRAYFIVRRYFKEIKNAVKHKKTKLKMSRKLIIDGNAVYELDENCMLKKRLEDVQTEKNQMEERRRTQENLNEYKRMLRMRQV